MTSETVKIEKKFRPRDWNLKGQKIVLTENFLENIFKEPKSQKHRSLELEIIFFSVNHIVFESFN